MRPPKAIWLFVLAVTVCLSLVGGTLVVERWRQARDLRAKGLHLAQLGRFFQGEAFLRKALENNPQDVVVVRALALGHLEAGNGPEAQAYLGRWILLQHSTAEPLEKRLELELALRHYDAAIRDGLRLLQLAPERDEVRRTVTYRLLELCRWPEAEQLCRAFLQDHPGDPEFRYYLALARHSLGHTADAEAILDPLIHEHPEAIGATLFRAMLAFDAGRLHDAIPLLRAVLQRDPARKVARYYLGLCLARTGQAQDAAPLFADCENHQRLPSGPWTMISGNQPEVAKGDQ
jgi:tetratricopeptide (TPR) repeat protein